MKLYLLQNKHCFQVRWPAKPHFPDPASRSPLSGQLRFGAMQVPAGRGRPENRARWAGVLASGLRNPPRPRSFLGQGEEQDPWGRRLGDGHCPPSAPHPPAVFPCTGLVGQGLGFYSVTMESTGWMGAEGEDLKRSAFQKPCLVEGRGRPEAGCPVQLLPLQPGGGPRGLPARGVGSCQRA